MTTTAERIAEHPSTHVPPRCWSCGLPAWELYVLDYYSGTPIRVPFVQDHGDDPTLCADCVEVIAEVTP